jgi:MFS family permease
MVDLSGSWRAVAALGSAQTLAWASTFYLPAVLAGPMARDLGLPVTRVFAAFSLALLVSAAVGPLAGRAIDRWGGRPVLIATNGVFALGLLALSRADGAWGLFAAWVVIGIGMGSGLYEAAFAALVRLYGHAARSPITGITLLAGFASTVGWPLSAAMEAGFGWRGACVGWALLHLGLGLPLNLSLPRVASPTLPADPPTGTTTQAAATAPAATASVPGGGPDVAGTLAPPVHPLRAAGLLAFVFAATWFVSTAMASHLPRVLQAGGATLATAVALGALVGPAQVAGRVLEFSLLRRLHPLLSARLAAAGHPLGVAALMAAGAPAAAPFVLLHGAGNGIMTIAKGTLPLALFGPRGYGELQGWLLAPTRLAQAAAPLAFGWCLERWGAHALWLTAGLSALAWLALMALPRLAGWRRPSPLAAA